MPLREAFYLGAACQIGATVRLSGPADKSAALFGASRLDPFGALRPRINRAEATSRLTAQPGACARWTGSTALTGRPKSKFFRQGGGAMRSKRAIWPPERPEERFSCIGRGLAHPEAAFVRYTRSGAVAFFHDCRPGFRRDEELPPTRSRRALAGRPPGELLQHSPGDEELSPDATGKVAMSLTPAAPRDEELSAISGPRGRP